MKYKLSIFFLICAALLLNGCRSTGSLRDGVFQGHGVRYRVGDPGAGWQKNSLPDADIAWIYGDGLASLLINSRCVGTKDVPLEALASQLLIGMTEQDQISAVREQRSGREALETTSNARIDGVLQVWKSYVLKKDGCVYDIVLVADPQSLNQVLPGYEATKQLFDVYERMENVR